MHPWVFGANYLIAKIVTQLIFFLHSSKMHESLQKVPVSY